MTEYFKKFTMDKDEVTVIDFGEHEVFECKYSDEAKSLCNRLNDLDYEKYNLKKENEQLKKEYNLANRFYSLDKSKYDAVVKENEQLRNQMSISDDTINDLISEIEQLKSELRTLRNFRGFITEKNVFNEKERKELQLQMLRLYNYFEDYFEDAMSPSSFSEMWDTVKESEKWEKRRC